ncbi:MAG: hypothetical protein R3C05_14115 [Pirellulaceae bacterium]
MKDLYRKLSLSEPIDSQVLLRAAISECKDVEIKKDAEAVLLDDERKRVYDRTYAALKTISEIRQSLQLPVSKSVGLAGDFEVTGTRKSPRAPSRPSCGPSERRRRPRPRGNPPRRVRQSNAPGRAKVQARPDRVRFVDQGDW